MDRLLRQRASTLVDCVGELVKEILDLEETITEKDAIIDKLEDHLNDLEDVRDTNENLILQLAEADTRVMNLEKALKEFGYE